MSELEILRGEANPRSAATCARLGGRVDSIGGFIAYGVLWLFIACGVATAVLFAAIVVTGPQPSGAAGIAALIAWVLGFVLAWLPFVRWVARRRGAGRALIRDGVLIAATIEHVKSASARGARLRSASIRFVADGHAHHGLFSAGGTGLVAGAATVLYTPAAEYCLVFVTDDQRPIPARLLRDLTVDRNDARTTVTMRRGRGERTFVAVLALVLVQITYVGLRLTFFQRPSELRCERKSDSCTLTGSDIFGGGWDNGFPASGMVRSELESREHGELAWVVRMTRGDTRELGHPTGREAQRAVYRAQSDALAAFIANRAQKSFTARFEALGGPSGAMWLAIGLVFGYLLARLVHGWRTTLVFDRAAGELVITRAPALVPPGRRRIALADVVRADARHGGLWLLYTYLPTVTIRILGADDKVLFRRRLAMDADIGPELAAINEFVAGTRRVAV